MKHQNLSTRRSHELSTRGIEISSEAYAFVLVNIVILLLSVYTSAQLLIKTLSLFMFYLVSTAIATTLAVVSLLSYIDIDLRYDDRAGVVEGLGLAIKMYLRPWGIARLILVKEIVVDSDPGLWITRWRFDRPSGCIEIEVSGYPGLHKIRGISVVIKPVTPLVKMRVGIAIEKPIEIRVAPKKAGHRFNVGAVIPHLLLLEGRASRRKGVGSEVMSVREFTPYDDYKKIHWKATAKTGKLMVKEYEQKIFRNAVLITSIHYWFFLGKPPPIVFLSKLVIDITETLTSIGLRVALGIVTEKDVKIVGSVDRYRIHEVYRALSEVEWPEDLEYIRYTSSNKVLRWFSRVVIEEVCREPCIVLLVVDPLDNVDVDSILEISKFLRKQKHITKILLTVPTTLRFLHVADVGLSDVANVESEISKAKRILAMFGHEDVYLPTVYLKL